MRKSEKHKAGRRKNMAWRPYKYLIGGELEFKKGIVRGYAYFLTAGVIRFKLKQNYILSGKVKFEKPLEQIKSELENLIEQAKSEDRKAYLKGFSIVQKGELGISRQAGMTASMPITFISSGTQTQTAGWFTRGKAARLR